MQPRFADPAVQTRSDFDACRAAIRNGSKSFHAASLLLPPNARRQALALYAFCRSSDDLVDNGNAKGSRATRQLSRRLGMIAAGTPEDQPGDRAFAAVFRQARIPAALPEALIEGFSWDEAGRRYETIDQLLAYCARVASTVGVMMTLIMGRRDRHVLARAAELGLAMQLTNIARDVGEDARNGRLYLPVEWIRDAGIDPDEFLRRPRHDAAIGAVVKRLLDTADEYYASALCGVAGLPLACRPAIRAAALVYREIGREIAHNGYNSVDFRAHTTARRKLGLLSRAVLSSVTLAPVSTRPAQPAVSLLVAAATEGRGRETDAAEGIGRFIELMSEFERRHRQSTALARKTVT